MLCIPSDAKNSLELDKAIEIMMGHCYAPMSKEQLQAAPIFTHIDEVELSLRLTDEYLKSIEALEAPPLASFQSVVLIIDTLKAEGYVLDVDHYIDLFTQVLLVHDLLDYFQTKKGLYPTLSQLSGSAYKLPLPVVRYYHAVFDENGNIKDTASPALGSVRKQIQNLSREIHRAFDQQIKKFAKEGLLSDIEESIKNGRRVLAVPSEFKRKIKGIIHSESVTGKTSYIEPEVIVHINNQLSELYIEEQKEIFKILTALSTMLHPHLETLKRYEPLLITLDVIRSKALFSRSIQGSKPQLTQEHEFKIHGCKHPLLLLKNEKKGLKTIPFDLTLTDEERYLLVSGPNAGGKSILIKSIGLNILLTQMGVLPAVASSSVFKIFTKIFTDIGDQQSIEDDLSTYSSRMKNAKAFIENADENTLMIIDEFGSGTDPKFGGAIAESILHQLIRLQSFGIVTTHYTNLKEYASHQKGIGNGAMEFDEMNLSPTYRLRLGSPGSSYAFEIATKSGLSKTIIQQAKRNVGENSEKTDNLLIQVQQKEKALLQLEEELKTKQKQLDTLIKQYQEQADLVALEKKKIKYEQKVSEQQHLESKNKRIEEELRKVVAERKEETLKSELKKIKEAKVQQQEVVNSTRQELHTMEQKVHKDYEFKSGDSVKLRINQESGYIVRIKKDIAIVEIGIVKMEVPLRDLIPSLTPIDIKKHKSIQYDALQSKSQFINKIDLRGYKPEHASKMLDDFLDQAMIANADNLEVIHGKGSGVIRRLVHAKLRQLPASNQFYHPADNSGGEGVTLVTFD